MKKQEIKDNYAKEQGYDNWNQLLSYLIAHFKDKEFAVHENKVMEIYAMEVLKKASNRFEEKTDKFYIHNENNLIK